MQEAIDHSILSQGQAVDQIVDTWGLVRGQQRSPQRAAVYVEEMAAAAERLLGHCRDYLDRV